MVLNIGATPQLFSLRSRKTVPTYNDIETHSDETEQSEKHERKRKKLSVKHMVAEAMENTKERRGRKKTVPTKNYSHDEREPEGHYEDIESGAGDKYEDVESGELEKEEPVHIAQTCYLVHNKGKRCQKVTHRHIFSWKMRRQVANRTIKFVIITKAEVNEKIEKAYCPPKIVEGNPCLEYIKYLVLPWFKQFTVERGADNGGNKTFKSFEELVADYECGGLQPGDLKLALSKSLNEILKPVREHFRKDSNAKELLESVKASLV